MARPRAKQKTRAGIGQCGTPFCEEPKAPNHFVCANHLEEMQRIKLELDSEAKVRSVRVRNGRERQPPTCCWLGCMEPRQAGNSYCSEHAGEENASE